LVGALAGLAIALTATKIYRAEVVIAEVRDKGMGAPGSLLGQFSGLASLAGVNLPLGEGGQEARALLKSRRLVEEFIKRQDLLGELSGSAGKPLTLWRAVRDFRDGVMTVSEDTRKGVTTVWVDWRDPVKAARWANELVALANELLRTRALDDASRNIAYLKKQIASTDVVEMQRVMYTLIESEMKTLMLANARHEYAFTIIDPAVPPELKYRPRRSLIVLGYAALGFLLGAGVAFFRSARARERGAATMPAAS
jgi:uncharacterized protein involved in exopolysaccharide biosynthesis